MSELFEFAISGTFGIIGILEWLKKLNIKNFDKWTPYLSLILSIVLGYFAARTYDIFTTWNVIACSGIILATTQLGYQTIMKVILQAIENFVTKKTEKE